jgi:catechol 2,3-dioxygenase-like lactoylglutathione lyase family enzyme
MGASQIQAIFPKFLVRDVSTSLAYYRDTLGFDVSGTFGDPVAFGIVERDGLGIHLKLGKPRPRRSADEAWDAYFEVRGVDALHLEFLAKSAQIVRAPQHLPYGMKEFDVVDPDGYVLCFAEDLESP